MNKAMLQVGDLIKLRNGEVMEVKENGELRNVRQVTYLTHYNEDLKHKFVKEFDIIKIIRY